MRFEMIAACIGIGAVAWGKYLPYWWLLAAFAAALLLLRWRTRSARIRRLAGVLGALLLGTGWATGYGHIVTRSLLPAELEQQPLWLSGRITGLIEQREAFGKPAQRFTLRVDHCELGDGGACGVSLHTAQLTAYRQLDMASGESWRLPVRLKRPRGFANPGGFDFESWQVQRRISGVGSVATGKAQRLAPAPWWSADRWRAQWRDRLQGRLAAFAHADLLLALLVADDSGIERTQWRLFRDTGTIHLFVVSGSHIAFTGGLVWWLTSLWRRSPLATGSRREQWLGAVPAWVVALLYAAVAGFGLPIQRALIMFAVFLGTTIVRREVRSFDALLLALTLVLLHDPLAARDVGCWFSFAAVAALLIAFAGAPRRAQRDRWPWARAQWLVFLVCIPILMLIGAPLTLLSLPANAVAVPLTTLITLPAALLALLADGLGAAPGDWCWWVADRSLHGLLLLLEGLRAQGGGGVLPLIHDPLRLAFLALALGLWLLPRGIGARLLAPVLLLPVLWPPVPDIAPGNARVTVFDVGQGLSVLVETHAHRLLYDTGPAFGGGGSAAELAVLPAMRQRGIAALDLLMISHHDSDHAGGVGVVLDDLTVRAISLGEPLLHAPRLPRRPQPCERGQRWRWDEIEFSVLHPAPNAPQRGNDRSCVLRIDAGGASVLLTGDIGAAVERRLVAAALAPATVVVAPHHGSRHSSTAELIAALQPRYVVFSAGYRNAFRHPHPQVEARYRDAGAVLLNTAYTGALTIDVGPQGVASVTEFRGQRRHYWDEPPISTVDPVSISDAVLHLPQRFAQHPPTRH